MNKNKKPTTHYVDNERLFQALVEYKNQPEPRVMSDEIGIAIQKICEGLSLAKNFRNYTYRDELVEDAIENVVYAVPFFNPERTQNPFGYFTLVAWRAFIRRIQIEQKQNYIKHKNFQRQAIESEAGTVSLPNDLSNDVVEKYEARLAKTKRKQKERAGLLKLAEETPDIDPDMELQALDLEELPEQE